MNATNGISQLSQYSGIAAGWRFQSWMVRRMTTMRSTFPYRRQSRGKDAMLAARLGVDGSLRLCSTKGAATHDACLAYSLRFGKCRLAKSGTPPGIAQLRPTALPRVCGHSREAIMKATKTVIVCLALALASVGAAYGQGGGGGGGGGTSAGAGVAGGANGAGQGGAGISAPNTGATSGSTSMSKGSTASSPTRLPQKGPHAKGASDTAASGAQ
ncbi:hypothetical protein OKW34_003957 [Paraburkholderia youngii]